MEKYGFLITILLFAVSIIFITCDNEKENDPCLVGPQIVPSPPYDSPIWHPSGQFIGFNHTPLDSISYSDDRHCWGTQHFNLDSTGFWLIDPDGTEKRMIFPHTLQTPAWSPDGQWIAFVSGAQIFKMKFTGTTFDTTSLTQLTLEGNNFFPAWSPDGELIAYDSNNESPNGMSFIWMMKADGTQKKRIAYDPDKGEIRNPNWSPDGKKIVHIRYLGEVTVSEIFVIDTAGYNPIRLTEDSRDDRHPLYSSNGAKIAFWSSGDLWLMDTTGSNRYQLTTEGIEESHGLPFSWSSDESQMVYTVYNSNDWEYENGTLWILNLNTGQKKQLTYNTKPLK